MIPSCGPRGVFAAAGRGADECRVTLLEYRNRKKTGNDAELLADCAILRAAMPTETVKLILDDRADLVEQMGFDGVHVDAGDVPPVEARRLVGSSRIVGTSVGVIRCCLGFWRSRWIIWPWVRSIDDHEAYMQGFDRA